MNTNPPKPTPLTLAEQKARDSKTRRLRAEFNGKLTRQNQPEYRQFTMENMPPRREAK